MCVYWLYVYWLYVYVCVLYIYYIYKDQLLQRHSFIIPPPNPSSPKKTQTHACSCYINHRRQSVIHSSHYPIDHTHTHTTHTHTCSGTSIPLPDRPSPPKKTHTHTPTYSCRSTTASNPIDTHNTYTYIHIHTYTHTHSCTSTTASNPCRTSPGAP
jgi:hypothetical protein